MGNMKVITYCKDCIFWDRIYAGTTTRYREGRCRRHAPTPRADEISRDFGTVWPATFDDDWCGEGQRAGETSDAILDHDRAPR
jgi:hypothetical protein